MNLVLNIKSFKGCQTIAAVHEIQWRPKRSQMEGEMARVPPWFRGLEKEMVKQWYVLDTSQWLRLPSRESPDL
uniref:Uncharacterized protein n=1 Tax=Nelumbo nucifera TaxID=4432 RepID=A0A822XDH9_NELNU|nr:TPA_asm: hypothetical protein HUJ06_019853 [Nelumbo nucifera]